MIFNNYLSQSIKREYCVIEVKQLTSCPADEKVK